MAFRTISRLDNRALAVFSYTGEKREREIENWRRNGVLSPALLYLIQHGISYKPFKNECMCV